jgi:hypothetical protein
VTTLVHWNGKDVPDELSQLPAGTYVVDAVDEAPSFTSGEHPSAGRHGSEAAC